MKYEASIKSPFDVFLPCYNWHEFFSLSNLCCFCCRFQTPLINLSEKKEGGCWVCGMEKLMNGNHFGKYSWLQNEVQLDFCFSSLSGRRCSSSTKVEISEFYSDYELKFYREPINNSLNQHKLSVWHLKMTKRNFLFYHNTQFTVIKKRYFQKCSWSKHSISLLRIIFSIPSNFAFVYLVLHCKTQHKHKKIDVRVFWRQKNYYWNSVQWVLKYGS